MSFHGGLRSAIALAVVGLVFSAHAISLTAQTTSASVSGTVQDSQGGVLPGATVMLTSLTQGQTFTAVTDAEGRFVLPVVRPDTYTLQASLEGFKTLERANVVVNANDKFSTGILTLDVGDMTEQVLVTSRVTEVQASSGERSFALESEALKNIANNGRALFNFVTLVPGAVQQGMGGNEIGAADGFTVNARGRTRTTSRLTASPTSTPATTAATWRPPTSTPSRSSRSSPTPIRPSTAARSAARSRWSPRAARSSSTAPATGMAGGLTGTRTPGRTSA
ncbi:MAG: hypothetical protein GEV06_06985 [Luteitalea sp.]|nr:hypothetical protein [Luteitalea sp.]